MQEIKPNKNILWVWRIRTALICLVPASLSVWFYPETAVIKDIINISWIIFFVAMYFVYLPIKYGRLSYKIDSSNVYLDYGVIYFMAKTIPISNIQFLTVSATPLESIFKVFALRITAPGGRLSCHGLSKKDLDSFIRILNLKNSD